MAHKDCCENDREDDELCLQIAEAARPLARPILAAFDTGLRLFRDEAEIGTSFDPCQSSEGRQLLVAARNIKRAKIL